MESIRKTFSILVVTAAVTLLNACSPGNRGAVPVPDVPPVKVAKSEQNPTNVNIAVRPLNDGRVVLEKLHSTPQTEVAYPSGTVGAEISSALRESLINKGLVVTQDAPLLVSGEVLQWQSAIKAGVNKDVESKAQIYIEVIDTASGKRVFDGKYEGQQASSEGFVSDKDVQKSLGSAMQQAIAALVSDRDFLDTVWVNNQRDQVFREPRAPRVIR